MIANSMGVGVDDQPTRLKLSSLKIVGGNDEARIIRPVWARPGVPGDDKRSVQRLVLVGDVIHSQKPSVERRHKRLVGKSSELDIDLPADPFL
jgi:hypothetical protein